MTTTTNTPELTNVATVEGEAFKHDLKIENKEISSNGEKRKMDVIMGSITVRTGENELHTVRLYSRELTTKGEKNKMFEGYKTVMNEMVTVTDISEGKAPEGAEPTKLRVNGSLSKSEYFNEGGFNAFLQTQGRFVNRVKTEEGHTFEPKATYDVEGIVISRMPEIKDGEETGRQKVRLLIPTYNGAIEEEFISREQDGEYIEENFEVNGTVNLYGAIINYSKKIEKEIEAGFGENKVEISYESVRELGIRGGKVYDEDSNKAFSQEQINALQAKRNEQLAKLEADFQARQSGGDKKDGFGQGNTSNKKPDVTSMF
jgi:hypothetical protein